MVLFITSFLAKEKLRAASKSPLDGKLAKSSCVAAASCLSIPTEVVLKPSASPFLIPSSITDLYALIFLKLKSPSLTPNKSTSLSKSNSNNFTSLSFAMYFFNSLYSCAVILFINLFFNL